MILRRLFHALPVVAFTLFVLVLLNLQLRTRNDIHPGAHFTHGLVRSQARSTATNHHRDDAAADEREPTARSWKETNPESPLELSDVFIAVKTTGRFHKTRLALLLETWISRTKDHVSVSWMVLSILFMNVSSLSRMLIAVYGNWWCHRMCVRAVPAGWQARAHPVASTGRFVQRSCRCKTPDVPKTRHGCFVCVFAVPDKSSQPQFCQFACPNDPLAPPCHKIGHEWVHLCLWASVRFLFHLPCVRL